LVLARRLEAALSKRRILEIYLNVIELGPGLYGVEAAARHYYGAPASALGREAAASLAALLPQPSLGDVHSSNRAYQARRRAILARSEQATWIRRLL
jgi:monofunctional biosynthetic peptidoglycan transglycosylase